MGVPPTVYAIANAAFATAYVVLGSAWLIVYSRRRSQAAALKAKKESRAAMRSSPGTKRWPPISFVCPVKGTHEGSSATWQALMHHGYEGPVEFVFVVQEKSDPAFAMLQEMIASGALKLSHRGDRVRLLVAGLTTRTSQKLHNLIHAIESLDDDEDRRVLMCDDDMLLAEGAVATLVAELDVPNTLAAGGFSCDVPAKPSVWSHAGSFFRLLLDVSASSGGANAAWGGLCMMRRADLRGDIPDGVMWHWKNGGYSDDWIITQVARRLGKRIANPPMLCLNFPHFRTRESMYNFLHRQFFVLDTYVEDPRSWTRQPHRVESYVLAHLMAFGGLLFAHAPPVTLIQMVSLAVRYGAGEPVAALLSSLDVVLLGVCVLIAMPFCLLGGCAAVTGQWQLVAALSAENVTRWERGGRWHLWLAVVGFHVYCAHTIIFSAEGIYGRNVVWSGVAYRKEAGRVASVRRLDAAADSEEPPELLAVPLLAKSEAELEGEPLMPAKSSAVGESARADDIVERTPLVDEADARKPLRHRRSLSGQILVPISRLPGGSLPPPG